LCTLGADVLKRIGPEDEQQAVDRLIGRLSGANPSEVLGAADALGAMGPGASDAIPQLQALAENRPTGEAILGQEMNHDWKGIFRVLSALESIGTKSDPRIFMTLVRLLENEDPNRRGGAAMMLSHHAPPTSAAVPALIAGLKDQSPSVRFWATQALGRYQEPESAEVIPALIQALDDQNELVRCHAAASLAHYNAGADQAIPAALRLIDHPDPTMRRAAIEILATFGPAATEAIPAVQRAQTDQAEWVRDAAAKALKQIDPRGRKVKGIHWALTGPESSDSCLVKHARLDGG